LVSNFLPLHGSSKSYTLLNVESVIRRSHVKIHMVGFLGVLLLDVLILWQPACPQAINTLAALHHSLRK